MNYTMESVLKEISEGSLIPPDENGVYPVMMRRAAESFIKMSAEMGNSVRLVLDECSVEIECDFGKGNRVRFKFIDYAEEQMNRMYREVKKRMAERHDHDDECEDMCDDGEKVHHVQRGKHFKPWYLKNSRW